MLIGIGKQTKPQMSIQSYTVSFSIYDPNKPATQTGDAPSGFTKLPGETFTIPSQGNIVRTEVTYQSPPGGGAVEPINNNISLYAWSDGNSLYFPGDTYTMPSSDITLSAIWQSVTSPFIESISPTSASVGSFVDMYGIGLGTVSEAKFWRNKYTTFTVFSDYHIRLVVPSGAANGSIIVYTLGGGISSKSGFTVV